MPPVDFTGTKLGGANLNNAAITSGNGQIPVSHYDQYRDLIGPERISWRDSSCPSEASFSDSTVCPNGSTLGVQPGTGLSIAEMMQARNPPTQWTSKLRSGARRLSKISRRESARRQGGDYSHL
jgi:hypothetical protein